MIVGVGVGWVDVPRFEAALARRPDRLRDKVFTESERAFAARRARGYESLAVRFAAKVAARRALGLRQAQWQDVEVRRRPGRPPTMHFYGAAARAARRLGVTHCAVTLTHDALCCIGQVVLECDEASGAAPDAPRGGTS